MPQVLTGIWNFEGRASRVRHTLWRFGYRSIVAVCLPAIYNSKDSNMSCILTFGVVWRAGGTDLVHAKTCFKFPKGG